MYETGFRGYLRPDHGRMIWGETGKSCYGLYDRALGAMYMAGIWETLEKDSLEAAKKIVNEPFGTVDILLNGAGGNNPKGTTTKEYHNIGDENLEDVKTFFDLDHDGVSFALNLIVIFIHCFNF